jgi:hypothetical protein
MTRNCTLLLLALGVLGGAALVGLACRMRSAASDGYAG